MSDETKPIDTPTTTPTKKKWWVVVAAALASVATGGALLWPKGQEAKTPDNPLVVVWSFLTTNWDAQVQGIHDPRLPVTITTLTNGATATNWINVNVRRAAIHRTSMLGFKTVSGGILPLAEARVVAGSIDQTNGVDTAILNEYRINK